VEETMAFTSWRGVVGTIKPNIGTGPTEELIRILPDGIGLLPLALDLPQERGAARLKAGRIGYDRKIGELAELGADLALPEGSALFMKPGPKAEAKMVGAWEKKHKIPVVTQGMGLRAALRTMKIKHIIGIRPNTWADGLDYTANYFAEDGFDVLSFVSPEGYDLASVHDTDPKDVYRTAKQAWLKNPRADAIVIIAQVMQVGSIIQTIEDDLGIPVISALGTRSWAIQKHLHVRQPISGYGRLLRELP
jgi:maleate cis-trans isomerase